MRVSKTKVQLAMINRGIPTQKELAEKTGLNPNTMVGIMRGAQPKLTTLQKLAAALGVDPAELLEDGK